MQSSKSSEKFLQNRRPKKIGVDTAENELQEDAATLAVRGRAARSRLLSATLSTLSGVWSLEDEI